MKTSQNQTPSYSLAVRTLLLVSAVGLSGCSSMQATDTGFLKNRSEMTISKDGSTAYYRAPATIDPHQVRSLSVKWAVPNDTGYSSADRTRLTSALEAAIHKETEALPKVVNGKPVIIQAVITRVESVSPVFNVLTAVFLTVPLDRGGAAVEIEVLEADTLQPLASMAHAYFAPLSEFKARFSALAPAELALNSAAIKFGEILSNKN